MIILKERDQIPHGKFLSENWTDCRDDMMLEDPETNPCLIKKVSWINIFQDSKYFLDSLENICSGTRYVSWMDIFHDFKYFQDKRVSWILWKKIVPGQDMFPGWKYSMISNISRISNNFLDSLDENCSETTNVSWIDILHDFKYFLDKKVSWISWMKIVTVEEMFPGLIIFPGLIRYPLNTRYKTELLKNKW